MSHQRSPLVAIAAAVLLAVALLYLNAAKSKSENSKKYIDYQLQAMKNHDEQYGEDMNKWGDAAFAESTRQFKEHQCLDRYMEENYPFAQALTACKQEALLP